MKKKKLEKKKRSNVRERNWDAKHETAFSHDRVKHRRALVTLSERAADEAPLPADFAPNGILLSHSKKWAFVDVDGTEAICLIDERLQEQDATLLAPGDRVLVEWEGEDALIRGVAPRRTLLSRPAPEGGRVARQVLAANVDLLLVVAAAAQPPFRPGLVDRFLIAAQVAGVEPVLAINKMDLADAEPPETQMYRDLGVRVALVSCATGLGLDALHRLLDGKTAVLAGHSGVGKSSLLNRLDPQLRVTTQPVSTRTDRGCHTTSSGRLYQLGGGIRIIDTPGIRALGLWGVTPQELAFFFADIAEHAAACRFRDCTHTHEPGCAVLAAIEAGTLARARYESYLRIRASLESERNITPGRMAAKYQGLR